ncbi:hypothetical protein MXD81_54675, partial [Microbacteriaceae bacterium K1510]|nr:hypothetical protein [Microbacteriaceae bacterium K1510]
MWNSDCVSALESVPAHRRERGKQNDSAATTQPAIDGEPSDAAWTPDGKALLVATHAEKNRPIRLVKIDTAGTIKENYQIGEKPKVEEGIFWYQADGLTPSPNGRYVAFFVRTNSASLSAVGVSIQLLDLLQPSRKVELGGGLGYPEWFAWSPDSTRLAFIEGGGREAADNKTLAIADTRVNFQVIHVGQKGFVDSGPIRAKPDGNRLYYTRGKATTAWMGKYSSQVVLVPGQRIWERTSDGKQHAVTQCSIQTADYFPEISRDGKTLLFVRLDGAEHGSLYVKSTATNQQTEWLRHITG